MRFSLAHVLEWANVPLSTLGASGATARVPFTTVSMSSRPDGWPPMRPGGLFVAIHGERRDGHDFVADAFANGATAALVDHVPTHIAPAVQDGRVRVVDLSQRSPTHPAPSTPWQGSPSRRQTSKRWARDENHTAAPEINAADGDVLVVVDLSVGTMATLQQLGGWWRRRWGRPIVAIAGSVGKTTTKDLVTAVVSAQFRTLGTAGNLNNELGLPITLLGLHAEHEVGAVEIGISAPGEMAAFAAIAAPDVVVMTRIDVEHLEFLRDIETVAYEEGALIASLPASGTAVLNADDPRVLAMAKRTAARVATYGVDAPDAQTRAEDVRSRGVDGVTFRLCHAGESAEVRLPLAGRHFVSAATAAAAAGFAMGCGWEAVVYGLESTPTAPRIRVSRPADDFVLIDDTYNASPASCLAALELLAESPGTRVAILGDMLELGDFSAEAHATVGAQVPGSADALIAVGPESRATAHAATAHGLDPFNVVWIPRAADASDAFDTWRRASGVVGPLSVLVKGSRGMRMELATHDLERLAPTARSAAIRHTGERS